MQKQAIRHSESGKQKKQSEEGKQRSTVSSLCDSVLKKKLEMSFPRSNNDAHWH